MKMQMLCVSLGLSIALLGCSKERKVSFKTYPTKVTITQKGQPLADASVTLHPLDPNGRGAQDVAASSMSNHKTRSERSGSAG